jgi:pimeloyl-ACP methyl ester carboxylesterase
MPTAFIHGINIYYEDYGSGFPVLMSHGYSATGRMWVPQVEALRPRYRLISWDMRGHGQTDSPESVDQYSEELTVADMCGLLEHLGIREAVVGGLSLGGYMSLAFYLRHPQMVRALVLSDTGPGYRKDEARETWNRMAEERARAFEEQGLDALGSGAEALATALQHRSARGLALSARGMLAQSDSHVIDALPDIRVPTIVIVGEQDQPFLAATDYMAAKIPGARKVVIEGAGHAANIERAKAFNAVLLEFLDSLGVSKGS